MTFDNQPRKIAIAFLGLMALISLAMGIYHLVADKPIGSLTASFIICLPLIINLKKTNAFYI